MAEATTTIAPATTTTAPASTESVLGVQALPGKVEQTAPAATVGDKLYDGKTAEVKKIEGDKSPDQIEADKVASDKVAADKVAADKVEADKVAKDKAEGKVPDYSALKIPEGVTVDDKALTTLKETLGKAGVPAETAQALVDMHFNQLKTLSEAAVAANTKLWTDTQAEWRGQLDKDPELGGDKKAATAVRLGKALDEFGSKEAREAFDLTGAGNNPHIVRFINKMAAALEEGGPVTVGGPTGKKGESLGARLYGNNS